MKLKMDLSERDLGYRFEVSISHVSSILSTFIPFLGFEMSHLIVWPKVSALSAYYPTCFAAFGKVISIIDFSEVFAQKPSLSSENSKMFSSYKSQTTVKFLVSCTPSGAISFVSDAFTGSMSDREIVQKSGYLECLKCSFD